MEILSTVLYPMIIIDFEFTVQRSLQIIVTVAPIYFRSSPPLPTERQVSERRLGPVVQSLISSNPGLNVVNESFSFVLANGVCFQNTTN